MNKYWEVTHNADCTETGFPMRKTYIKTIWKGSPAQQFAELEILETFCFERFGDKVVFVQGVAPTPNWKVWESSKVEFENAKPILWGGYPTKTIRLELGIGHNKGVGILLEEEVA